MIWEILAQQEEPRHDEYYKDRKKISTACTEILRLFKERGLLDEVIIEVGSGFDGDYEALTIQNLLTEIIDEYTKKLKRCNGIRPVGFVIGYRSPYCNAGLQRTNRDTCWYCGAPLKLEESKENKHT